MELGLYYIDLNKKLGEDFSEYEFDETGRPLTRLYRRPNWKHNPITVCNYGLFHFNKYLRTNSIESKNIFLSQANWLVENAQPGANNSLVWYYLFDLPFYKIKAPWISGMAQGQALSVLLRAHQLSLDDKYFFIAHSAFKIFDIEKNHQGVISRFPDGKPVIEEYPSPQGSTSVLNGFIYAIMGVYDYFLWTEELFVKQKFECFCESLMANLFRYDSGYWSYYDLVTPYRLSSKSYHRIHIHQLKQLHKLTQGEIFSQYATRWNQYLNSPKSHVQWLLKKMFQKLMMLRGSAWTR